MMGHRQVEQAALFYEFSLERHIPADHLQPTFATESAQSGHGVMPDLSPLCGQKADID
ncbi:hypothetical protein [Bradyrhizobium sp. AZCC 2230]|uniref:hypothetical protein n=1 Tax=Bradyrhizobium sp. AZCC 2230 TaxID=3117021 RepID=UPI002FF2DE2A